VSGDPHTFDFFIIYAKRDPDAVAAAKFLFHSLGATVRVFLDSECLLPGTPWAPAIEDAQVNSAVSLVLLSAPEYRPYYQQEEISRGIELSRASNGSHRVVPVVLRAAQDTMAPYGLHGLQRVEFEHWRELLRFVGNDPTPAAGKCDLISETIHLAELLDQLHRAGDRIRPEDVNRIRDRLIDRWMESHSPPGIR